MVEMSDTATLSHIRPPIRTSALMHKKKQKHITDEDDDLLDNALILRKFRDSNPERDNAIFELQLISELKRTLRDFRLKEEEEVSKTKVQSKQTHISDLFLKNKASRSLPDSEAKC